MKKNNLTTRLLAACCCLATLLAFASCADRDDDLSMPPQGAIPLRLGSVSIGGAETATRAASTRAEATPEDANGYTGLRKTHFVDGDVLTLTLSDNGGSTTRQLTATRQAAANSWQLSGPGSEKVYIIPGTTTITATHAGVAPADGSDPDDLVATTYTLDGQSISLSMTHANALIDVTFAKPVSDVSEFKIHFSSGDAESSNVPTKETDIDGKDHYTTILTPNKSVTQISLKINGVTYVAPLQAPVALAANKRFPISLSFKENRLIATVAAASPDWTIGEKADMLPPGYTYYIGTPEDLAQFAADTNVDDAPSRNASVLLTADIDLSQLKSVDDANAGNPGKPYNYTATPNDWKPIKDFAGSFNGNGHIISNMKITTYPTNVFDYVGFFSRITNAKITGIHLRDAEINLTTIGTSAPGACIGLLLGYADTSQITLCSVSGRINVDEQVNTIGGMMGYTFYNVITSRCSANVDITGDATDGLGGFVGEPYTQNTIVGCSSNGNIVANGGSKNGGFSGNTSGNIMGCSATGTISGTATDLYAFSNYTNAGVVIKSCCSSVTGAKSGFAPQAAIYTDCAYTETQSTGITGITGGVSAGELYNTLTATSGLEFGKVKTLHWSKTEGYTLKDVESIWYASAIWQDNADAAPTINLAYEGGAPLYNGKPSNLLVIDGYTSYWVAPEDALKGVTWNAINFNTVCPKGWHVPTKEEYESMSPTLGFGNPNVNDMIAIIELCFPEDTYWSSTAEGGDRAYSYYLEKDYGLGVSSGSKGMEASVRCVRKY